jgi:colanic acid/amylovoran biosynthesis protein
VNSYVAVQLSMRLPRWLTRRSALSRAGSSRQSDAAPAVRGEGGERILIINTYSPYELGDHAIFEATCLLIKHRFPKCRITVMSSFVEEFKRVTAHRVIRDVFYPPPGSSWLTSLLLPFVKAVHCCLYFLCYRAFKSRFLAWLEEDDPFRVVAESDIVIAEGGGYLYSSNKAPFSRAMMSCLLRIALAAALGKPAIVFPISLGPIRRKYEGHVVRWALKKAKTIAMREPISHELALELRLPPEKLRLVPDVAFLWSEAVSEYRPTGQQVRVLMTVADWSFAACKGQHARRHLEDYVRSLVDLIRFLGRRGVHVSVFPQVVVPPGDDDSTIAHWVAAQVGDQRCCVLAVPLRQRTNIRQILSLFGEFDLLVGTRMHSCILGMCAGIPTIALAYQPKTLGTFSMLGLQEYCLDATNVNSRRLQEMVSRVLAHLETEKVRFREVAKAAAKRTEVALLTMLSPVGSESESASTGLSSLEESCLQGRASR